MANSEDPDEMPHNKVAFHQSSLFAKIKTIIRDRHILKHVIPDVYNGRFHSYCFIKHG